MSVNRTSQPPEERLIRAVHENEKAMIALKSTSQPIGANSFRYSRSTLGIFNAVLVTNATISGNFSLLSNVGIELFPVMKFSAYIGTTTVDETRLWPDGTALTTDQRNGMTFIPTYSLYYSGSTGLITDPADPDYGRYYYNFPLVMRNMTGTNQQLYVMVQFVYPLAEVV